MLCSNVVGFISAATLFPKNVVFLVPEEELCTKNEQKQDHKCYNKSSYLQSVDKVIKKSKVLDGLVFNNSIIELDKDLYKNLMQSNTAIDPKIKQLKQSQMNYLIYSISVLTNTLSNHMFNCIDVGINYYAEDPFKSLYTAFSSYNAALNSLSSLSDSEIAYQIKHYQSSFNIKTRELLYRLSFDNRALMKFVIQNIAKCADQVIYSLKVELWRIIQYKLDESNLSIGVLSNVNLNSSINAVESAFTVLKNSLITTLKDKVGKLHNLTKKLNEMHSTKFIKKVSDKAADNIDKNN